MFVFDLDIILLYSRDQFLPMILKASDFDSHLGHKGYIFPADRGTNFDKTHLPLSLALIDSTICHLHF